MMIREFEIVVTPFRSGQQYKMKVEVIYESDQVTRYEVNAGQRSFAMEYQPLKKTGKWKIIKNPTLKTDNYGQAAMTIKDIQDKIVETEKILSGGRKGANPRNTT